MDFYTDRGWMRRRTAGPQIGPSQEFQAGVVAFLDFAYSHQDYVHNNKIRCPCKKCKLNNYEGRDIVEFHLLSKGFMNGYEEYWWAHGQPVGSGTAQVQNQVQNEDTSLYRMNEMVHDAAGPNFDSEEIREDDITPDAKAFLDMLEKSKEPLWDGCTKHSVLSATSLWLNIKSDLGISNEGFEVILEAVKSMMPDGERLPTSLYHSKKLLKQLRLGYRRIDACPNDCMLFYEENAQLSHCAVCGNDRYKPLKEGMSTKQKRIPCKILRYFPITDRLQRMYLSPRTAEHMTWHNKPSGKEGELKHPSDGEAWKDMNLKYPDFASEPRNVRLGLSTDGFNPFGHSAVPTTCWPVFLTPYNLPPWMCMKQQYLFLTLLVPGPNSPGKNLNVYLRPLIDELKKLWSVGVKSWDVYSRKEFTLRASLMWTISDFPAYGMLSGWSTHGKLACPYCMGRTKSFTLTHGGKPCWFDCHRCLLPANHPYRRNRDHFRRGKVDNDVVTPFSGQEVYQRVMSLPSGDNAITRLANSGYGVTHNWVQRSIFWELPYWPTNLIRHNLDVMHVEKNVFDNVFNTVMDIKKKTKDNGKARLDMAEICKRPGLELFTDDKGILRQPHAKYTLSKPQVTDVCKWIKSLKLPDGYASNIARCVKDDKFQGGMKSHDCHVFMERLLPIAFRDFLDKPIWDALTELSHFFRDICSKTLDEKHMLELEKSIIEIICKLEKIFPPGFFDSMEHLSVHLPYEARVGGPVQFRWMYPFERMMYYLKQKVKNRARVEGSICEAYSYDEVSMFMSNYFPDDVLTKANRVSRHDDGGDVELNGRLSVFGHPGRAYGSEKRIFLSAEHLHIAHTYILLNCPEIDQYVRLYENELKAIEPGISAKDIELKRDADFANWLKLKTLHDVDSIPPNVVVLAMGPKSDQLSYNGYKVNGWEFHTKSYGCAKSTTNTGVCVIGDCVDELGRAFYGELERIIQISYKGTYGGSVNLFQCRWFDSEKGLYVDRHGIIDIDLHMSSYANAPFVLPTQTSQVYYTRCPGKKRGRPPSDWHVVIHTPARHRVQYVDDEVYQDEIFQISSIVHVDAEDDLNLFEAEVEPSVVELQALHEPDIVELVGEPESETEDAFEDDGYDSPIDDIDESDSDNEEV